MTNAKISYKLMNKESVTLKKETSRKTVEIIYISDVKKEMIDSLNGQQNQRTVINNQ